MQLFTPYSVKGLTLKNRIVMAPMATHLGDGTGGPSPALIEYYRERARGGTGLVIIEAVITERYATTPPGRLGLWSDDLVAPMSEIAAAIAGAGAVPAVQIVDLNLRATGRVPADLSHDEIHGIVDSFVKAAERAVKAGFTMVEVHAAHSTTLSDFLSRRANRRTDAYGRNDAGRARIVVDIITALRAALGDGLPLFCRFNADEFTVNGNTLKHSIPISRLLVEAGTDVLDVSSGGRPEDGGARSYSQLRGRPAAWLPDGPNLHLGAAIRKATGAPVIAVGKLGDPSVAEAALAEGNCDLVALGRPLLAEPQWANKVQSGRTAAIKRCRCCDRCMELFIEQKPVHCVTFAES